MRRAWIWYETERFETACLVKFLLEALSPGWVGRLTYNRAPQFCVGLTVPNHRFLENVWRSEELEEINDTEIRAHLQLLLDHEAFGEPTLRALQLAADKFDREQDAGLVRPYLFTLIKAGPHYDPVEEGEAVDTLVEGPVKWAVARLQEVLDRDQGFSLDELESASRELLQALEEDARG